MAKKFKIVDRDRGFKKTIKDIEGLKSASVDSGIFQGKTNIKTGQEIVSYAAGNELKKSFLRSTADENASAYKRMLRSAIKSVVAGKETIVGAMTKLGTRMTNDIKKKITVIPWLDTGAQRNAVTWRVNIARRKVAEGKTGEGVSG